MDLQLEGKVIDILEVQSGESKNGPWRKQDFILETEGDYPKKVCITQWGENIEQFDLSEGDRITAHIDIQSREFKGRWYTDVKAWRIDKSDGAGNPSAEEPPFDPNDLPPDIEDDDLPF